MKVISVTTAFPRSSDDVLIPWIVRLIHELRSRGITTEVFTSSYRGRRSEVYEGIPVHRFRYFFTPLEKLSHDMSVPEKLRSTPLFFLVLPFFILLGMISAFFYGRRQKYDVIHVHFPFPLALFGIAMKGWRDIPVVYSFHGSDINLAHRNVLFRVVCSFLLSRADHVIVNSRFTEQRVRLLGGDDLSVTVIPMGSGDRPVVQDHETAVSRDGVCRILFVGRLISVKGVSYLLDAMRSIPPGCELTIVGDGPLRSELAAAAREIALERIVFTGYVAPDELPRHYRNADMFVLPSIVDEQGYTEGLGVVLIEAMMHGLPVIASNVGGIPDIVVHERTGLLVPQKDPDSLAAAICRLSRDESLRESLTRQAREHVKRRFSWRAVADLHERCYRDVQERVRTRR